MRIVYLLLLLSVTITVPAQFYIGPGAQVQVTGSTIITLKDIDLVNNGSFSTGNGTVNFSGAGNVSVGGTNPVQFFTIQINKEPGSSVVLQQPVDVSDELQFIQGLLDLNGHNLDLGSTGLLTGESEDSRIIGPAGGELLFTALLNAPSNSNPGNLGVIIESQQDLGSVLIKRGHKLQDLTDGSILRYYDIVPSNNSNLGATIRFHYFDAELNSLPESNLTLWRSTDAVNWSDQGYTSRDIAQNYVEKTGIDAFSAWTLSTSSTPLPVVFAGFYVQCDGGRTILRWKTAMEINSSHFFIERNAGSGWMRIGELAAAGNSSTEENYELIDNNPAEKAYYRIAQYDIDGQVKYSTIAMADCATADLLRVWPNPFRQVLTVKIKSEQNNPVILRITDAKGANIITRQLNLMIGLNQFDVDLQRAAAGVYLLTIEWPGGKQLKTMRLVKQ